MRTSTARPFATALVLACGVAALAGCTGSSSEELDLDGFSAGACTELTSPLRDVDQALRDVDDDELDPQEAGMRFKSAQDELQPIGRSAEDPVASSVTALVTQLGLFRIAVDTGTYDGSQVADVRTALTALARDCRAS